MDRVKLRVVKQHIMSWGTGTYQPAASPTGVVATIALADRRHLAAVVESGLVGPGTVMLVPGDDDRLPEAAVGYQGSLAEPGADLALGADFFLQSQDYASSQFMSVLGPTLLRITNPEDFSAFLSDADDAFAKGTFPGFAITPPVRIADLPALGGKRELDGPALRIYVGPDGTISTSPNGVPFGSVGASLEELSRTWQQLNDASELPCAVALGAAVTEAERITALSGRPFISRYLVALDALRMMAANEVAGVRASGFGGRLNPDLGVHDDACDFRDPDLPLVLWTDEQAYVYDTAGRVFAVDRTSAAAVECLIATGSPDAASDYVPPALLAMIDDFFAERSVRLGAARQPVATR